MLLDYLDTVRMWPIPKRKRFAMTLSVGLTGIIVLVWLSVLFMGPEPQNATTSDLPTTPVSTEQEPSGMWERLRTSIGIAPGEESANPPAESSASRHIPPEALGEFRNTFDKPLAPTAVATSTDLAPAQNAPVPVTQSPTTAPETDESGSMVESVLKEVE